MMAGGDGISRVVNFFAARYHDLRLIISGGGEGLLQSYRTAAILWRYGTGEGMR